MAAEGEKVVTEEEKPSELTMDTEVLRKTCNYALIKVTEARAHMHRTARTCCLGRAAVVLARHAARALSHAPLAPPRAPRQNCDMNEEMRQDCIELVITAIEKYQANYEVRSPASTRAQGAGTRALTPRAAAPPSSPPVRVPAGEGDDGQEVRRVLVRHHRRRVWLRGHARGARAGGACAGRARRGPAAQPRARPSARTLTPPRRHTRTPTAQVKHVIWLFFGGSLAVLVFKAGARQTGV